MGKGMKKMNQGINSLTDKVKDSVAEKYTEKKREYGQDKTYRFPKRDRKVRVMSKISEGERLTCRRLCEGVSSCRHSHKRGVRSEENIGSLSKPLTAQDDKAYVRMVKNEVKVWESECQ